MASTAEGLGPRTDLRLLCFTGDCISGGRTGTTLRGREGGSREDRIMVSYIHAPPSPDTCLRRITRIASREDGDEAEKTREGGVIEEGVVCQ